MKIKPITDDEVYALFELHYKLQQLLPFNFNRLVSLTILSDELRRPHHLAIGLYKNDRLVGFINGWEEDSTTFYLANIYIEPDSRLGIKKLMQSAEDEVIARGYKRWKATSFLEHSKKILEKFGGSNE